MGSSRKDKRASQGKISRRHDRTEGPTYRSSKPAGLGMRAVSVARDSRELLEQRERRQKELTALNRITAAISGCLDLDLMLGKVLETVLKITGMEAGYIQLLDSASRHPSLKVHRGLSTTLAERLIGGGRAGGKKEQVVSAKQSIVLEDMLPDYQGKFAGEGITAAAWVPMVSRNEVIGILTVATRKSPNFPRDTMALLESIGAFVGVAIENAQLFQEGDRRRKHAETLREIGLSLIGTHDPQQVLTRVAEEARQLVGALFTYVVTPNTPFYKFAAVAGDDQGYRSVLKLSDDPDSIYGRGPLGQAVRSGTHVICEDVLTDPLFIPWREIASARGIRSLVAVPLRGLGKTYGALLTYSPVPRAYDTETLNLLNALSVQAAASLENAQLFKETEKHAMELSTLHTVMSAVSGSIELNEILEKALHAVLLVTGMESGYVRLLEGEPPNLALRAHKGISPGRIEQLRRRTSGGKNTKTVLSTGRSLVIADIQDRSSGDLKDIRREGFTAAAWIPIVSKDRVVGIITLATSQAGAALQDQLTLLESIGASLGVAIENARLYEKVKTTSQELEALIKVNRDVAGLCDRAVLLPRIAEEARKILKVDSSIFRLVEGDSLVLVSGVDPQALAFRPKLDLHESLSGKIVRENRILAIKNVVEDPSLHEEHRQIIRNAGYRSFLGIPVRIGNRIVGTLNFYSKKEREFQEEEISLVTAFADQAAVALENSKLYEQSRRREESQMLIKEISLDITGLDIDAITQKLTERIRQIFNVDIADARVMIDGAWKLVGISGIEPERLRGTTAGGRGRSRWIMENRKPLLVGDISQHAELSTAQRVRQIGVRGYLGVPLFSRGGEVTGVLRALSFQPREFTREDVDLLQQLANGLAIALENVRLFNETQKRARELSALYAVMSAISGSMEINEVLERALHTILLVTGMESGRIRLLEGEPPRLTLKAHKGLSPARLQRRREPRPSGKSAEVLATRRTLILGREGIPGDAQPDSETLQEGFKTAAWIPIISKDKVLGIINLATRNDENLLRDHIPLLESIGASLGVAIENANLYNEAKKQEEIQKLLKELSQDTTSLDINALFQKLTNKICEFFKVDASDIRLLGEGETIFLVAASGMESQRLYVSRKIRGRTGWIIKNRQPLVIPDITEITNIASGHTVRELGMRAYVALPLFARSGSVVGVLRALTAAPREFVKAELDLLQQLANGAAIALENATLYQQSKRQEETQKLLKELSQDTTTLDIAVLFEKITEKVREFFKVDIADIRLLEEGGVRRLVGSSGIESERLYKLGKSRGRSGWIVETRRALVIPDTLKETTIPTGDTTREIGIRGYLAVPLFSRSGNVIGILRALSFEPREFNQSEVDLLQQLANGTAIAIENARLFQEATTKAREISALYEVTATLNQSLELEGVLKEVIEKIADIFGFDVTTIYLLDAQGDELHLRASYAARPGLCPERFSVHSGRGIVSHALQTGEPLVFENVQTDPVYHQLSLTKVTSNAGYNFFAAFPIKSKLKAIGALTCIGREPRKLTGDDTRLLNTMADQIGVAVDNTNLFHEVELRAQEQGALNGIAMAVSQFLHPDELLQISLDKVLDVIGRERGYIRLKDRVTGALRLVAHRGISSDYVNTLLYRRTPGGKTDRVFQSGEPLVINDPQGTLLKEETRREGSRSMAWIPLKARRGVVGILSVSTGGSIPFEPREVNLLLAIGNVIGVALENAQLFEESERLVHELEATTQQLSAKNKELDTFVYTVSHDLKAPLITLEGMAALLLDEYAAKLDPDAQHYLQRLMAGSKQMERLILDLLALSRIGREGRSPESVPLNQVVDDFLLEWAEIIRSKNIRITRHDLPTLWGVRTQIHQVITNLVANAIKYLGDSTDPNIEIGTANGDGQVVECYVKDNGIGIDPQYHEKIFETFQRLKDIEAEGTGVGLAIVKKIVETVGGRISVESVKGEGATFRFTWPRQEREVTHEQ